MTNIGKRLKKLRKNMDLKQKEVANQTGISSVNLSRYEKGNRTPDQETINVLAEFYNVSPAYLLLGENESKHDFLKDITDEEAQLLKEYLKEIRKRNKKE